jgi:hypothetical protein
MKGNSTHTLPSFTTYINKVFAFRQAIGRLRDARHDPHISPQTVFLALFHAFLFRLTSFKQLEADLAQRQLRVWIGAERAFGDDTLRYSLCGFALDPLEQMLVDINRRLKRNKALDQGRVQGRIVAALDGIEILSSYSRCCEFCLQRRVRSQDPEGNPVEQIQYYHRAVGCQIVSAPVKPFLAIEWVRPGEGEDTAAFRLLRRLPELYGSRFFDLLLLDSLYAQALLLKLAKQMDWEVVIPLKQQNRQLYQSAMGLFENRPADYRGSENAGSAQTEFAIWDTEGLPFSEDYPEPIRVVRSEEKVTRHHRRRGKLQSETTEQEWMWITNLGRQAFPAPLVRRLGHDRWKNENNGWNDLTQNWALKHGFLHACQHRPRITTAAEKPQPVPNRGLMAVTLILCLAFALSSAFTLLHSKLYRLYHPSLCEIARQLYRSLWQLQPPIRAPS